MLHFLRHSEYGTGCADRQEAGLVRLSDVQQCAAYLMGLGGPVMALVVEQTHHIGQEFARVLVLFLAHGEHGVVPHRHRCYAANPETKKKVVEDGNGWIDESTGDRLEKCQRR